MQLHSILKVGGADIKREDVHVNSWIIWLTQKLLLFITALTDGTPLK